ncbi:MAG: iron-siderophore ABC transporter substrate-binding protein [Actinomycetota bacterium]|nr:iron-siderophore ABC transporter substrate-binding protein [Actinomycetota bacterium]
MGSTEVPCTPERVVTLGQGQTDSTLVLGVIPVGVVEPWTEEFYGYLPDEVHDAEVVGSELEPDVEAIAALDPDLLLGSKLRPEAVYEQLSAIAPTVFAETIGRSWKDNVSLWAKALCRQEEGERVLLAWEERTAAFKRELGELADTDVSMIRFMPDEVRIYLTGFPGSVLRDAGLQRPPAQRVDDWETSDQLVAIMPRAHPRHGRRGDLRDGVGLARRRRAGVGGGVDLPPAVGEARSGPQRGGVPRERGALEPRRGHPGCQRDARRPRASLPRGGRRP